jgi:hypothetical protein
MKKDTIQNKGLNRTLRGKYSRENVPKVWETCHPQGRKKKKHRLRNWDKYSWMHLVTRGPRETLYF